MRRMGLLAVAFALALAGCGGGDDNGGGGGGGSSGSSSGGGGQTLELAAPADGSIKFDKTELTAKAGKVTIKFSNPASVPHAVEIEGNGVEKSTDTITKSDASITVDLKAGEYEYYCPVGQHRQNGMEGKLTVS